jgi:hypothetical protein
VDALDEVPSRRRDDGRFGARLGERGVDLVVSNQAHRAWRNAMRRSGFLRGPSNFAFAVSEKLAALFAPFERQAELAHLTRGDGEGATHL